MDPLPLHSPLGASSAERWMNCPGSVPLIKSIHKRVDADADPEYRTDGTAAHAAIAHCLVTKCDAWEVVGEKFGDADTVVSVEMADAIQDFLDKANAIAEGAERVLIEERISAPDHPMFYGTVDFAAIKEGTLYILDFKYGQGIVVETENNPQIMYYAYGILREHPDVRQVYMRIVQPRIPFPSSSWEVAAEDIAEWAEKTLFPAMDRTATDKTLTPGPHCRFCDAKEYLICPALKAQFVKAQEIEVTEGMDDQELLAAYPLIETVKMHVKALGDEMLRRLVAGRLKGNSVVKLVNKKANRVWKAEAPALFKERFGDKALNPAELKSPAEMEKIDATAKKLVHEYAYTPQSGYTVADADDKRPAVVIQTATEVFKGALDNTQTVQ